MDEITTHQMFEAREELEEAGATWLGKILFEFTRLDMCLGLCVAWIDSGQRLEALTKKVEDQNFSQRLELLKKTVSEKLVEGSDGSSAYWEWISVADRARVKRNELFHGRWAVNGMGTKLINIMGLPTSNKPSETEYKLSELQNFVNELKLLQTNLNKCRSLWPL